MSDSPAQNHEAQFVRAFFKPEKQERWLSLLFSKKRRREFLEILWHCRDFHDECRHAIASNQDSVDGIVATLKKAGAGEHCHIISTGVKLDNREMPLIEAVAAIHCSDTASCFSCIPGRLGYYEGEDGEGRAILIKRNDPRLNSKKA